MLPYHNKLVPSHASRLCTIRGISYRPLRCHFAPKKALRTADNCAASQGRYFPKIRALGLFHIYLTALFFLFIHRRFGFGKWVLSLRKCHALHSPLWVPFGTNFLWLSLKHEKTNILDTSRIFVAYQDLPRGLIGLVSYLAEIFPVATQVTESNNCNILRMAQFQDF